MTFPAPSTPTAAEPVPRAGTRRTALILALLGGGVAGVILSGHVGGYFQAHPLRIRWAAFLGVHPPAALAGPDRDDGALRFRHRRLADVACGTERADSHHPPLRRAGNRHLRGYGSGWGSGNDRRKLARTVSQPAAGPYLVGARVLGPLPSDAELQLHRIPLISWSHRDSPAR